MTKKAKTKKTPRARTAKPAHGAHPAAAKPSHPAAHAKSHVEHVQTAPIVSAPLKASVATVEHMKSDAEAPSAASHDAKSAKNAAAEKAPRSLISRVVTLVVGLTEALLPKRFPIRKPAH